MVRDGCSFGRESRIMIQDIKSDVTDIKDKIDDMDKNLSNRMTELYNHQSTRPTWITSIAITVLTGIVIGFIVNYFSGG